MTYPKSLPHPNKPAEALATVSSLRMVAEKLERSAVKEALLQGWTWAQIAESLGVTRQAAHKRHATYLKNMEN
ncbi:MAG: helix-turn-helix domain-containing protein [Gammaproteobacteria bacterium]|jgi:transcriptional regulator with GAF, ATPase, and Fis domain